MKHLITLILFTLLSSCHSNKIKREDLIGTYIFNEGGYKIELKADGTYKHSYMAAHGNIIEKSGTWELQSFGREVLFKDFSLLTKNSIPQDWSCKLRIEKNKVDLMYDWKEDVYYRKLIYPSPLQNVF